MTRIAATPGADQQAPTGSVLLGVLGVGLAVAAGWAVAAFPARPLPLVAIIGLTGAVVALLRLELAAAALAASIAGNLSSVAVHTHGLPSPSVVLGAVIVIGILLRRDRWTFLPPLRLGVAFGIYGLVVLLSAFWAADPLRSLEVGNGLVRDMSLAIVVAMVVRRTGTLRLTLWAMFATIATLGLVGTIQHLTGAYGRSFGGLGGAVEANIVTGTDGWRIEGPLGDPNYFGQTLVIGVAIGLICFLHERRFSLRIAAAAGTTAAAFAILPTYSRGGAVALLVVIGFAVLSRRPPLALVGLVLAGMVVGLLAAPADFRDRLEVIGALTDDPATIQEAAVRGRVSEMVAAAMMFRDAPLVGVGAGNYPAEYPEYAQTLQLDDRRAERAPHSLYLEIAAETGLVGLAAFLSLLVVMGRSLLAHRRGTTRRGTHVTQRGSGEALGLAMLAFLVTSVLLHAAHARIFWLLAALVLALPEVVGRADQDEGVPVLATRSHSEMSLPDSS